MSESEENKPKPGRGKARKKGFFGKLVDRLDASMKAKAGQKGDACCKGDDGKGGKCC